MSYAILVVCTKVSNDAIDSSTALVDTVIGYVAADIK